MTYRTFTIAIICTLLIGCKTTENRSDSYEYKVVNLSDFNGPFYTDLEENTEFVMFTADEELKRKSRELAEELYNPSFQEYLNKKEKEGWQLLTMNKSKLIFRKAL